MFYKANSLVAFIIFCQLKNCNSWVWVWFRFSPLDRFDVIPGNFKWRQDLSDKSKVDGYGRKLNFPWLMIHESWTIRVKWMKYGNPNVYPPFISLKFTGIWTNQMAFQWRRYWFDYCWKKFHHDELRLMYLFLFNRLYLQYDIANIVKKWKNF